MAPPRCSHLRDVRLRPGTPSQPRLRWQPGNPRGHHPGHPPLMEFRRFRGSVRPIIVGPGEGGGWSPPTSVGLPRGGGLGSAPPPAGRSSPAWRPRRPGLWTTSRAAARGQGGGGLRVGRTAATRGGRWGDLGRLVKRPPQLQTPASSCASRLKKDASLSLLRCYPPPLKYTPEVIVDKSAFCILVFDKECSKVVVNTPSYSGINPEGQWTVHV